jgi:hypothetical protein
MLLRSLILVSRDARSVLLSNFRRTSEYDTVRRRSDCGRSERVRKLRKAEQGGTEACNPFVRLGAGSSAARRCRASLVPSWWVALFTIQQNARVWARLVGHRLESKWCEDYRADHCTVQVSITVWFESNDLLSTTINTQCPCKAARLVVPHRLKLSLNPFVLGRDSKFPPYWWQARFLCTKIQEQDPFSIRKRMFYSYAFWGRRFEFQNTLSKYAVI